MNGPTSPNGHPHLVVLFLLALSPLASASGQGAPAADPEVSAKARGILKQQCYACHGRKKLTPDLNVLERSTLVASRGDDQDPFVLPGNLDRSTLWQVIDSDYMPKKPAPALTDEEKLVLKTWILGGGEFPPAAETVRPPRSNKYVLETIHRHLTDAPANVQPFLRYLTITHLHNQRNAVSDEHLRYARAALSKALNSLSRSRQIHTPKAIDEDQTIFVIDLRDYKWSAELWRKLLASYPYGLDPKSVQEKSLHEKVANIMKTDFDGITHVRGDWFAVTATRPPLYEEFAQIPTTLGALEAELKVNRSKDLREDALVRAGLQESGVSTQNRVVDVHETERGLYWISYDFEVNSGRSNIARFPLGPEFADHPFPGRAFKQAGSEIIFCLPNGLHAYMLVDKENKRITEGPIKIVADQDRSSGTPVVVNGISCISCHAQGLREVKDVIGNAHGLQNAAEAEKADALYDATKMRARLDDGKADYLKSLKKTIGPFLQVQEDANRPIEAFAEPITTVALKYDEDMSLETVAAELGELNLDDLRQSVTRLPVLRGIGLGVLGQGKTIKRTMWTALEGGRSPFQETALQLGIGVPLNNLP